MNLKLPLIFLEKSCLLLALFLISNIGFAQVKQINIKIINLSNNLYTDDYPDNYFIFQLGNRMPQQIAPNYAATFEYLLFEGEGELVDLEDTLYISHPDYIFEELPISHQDYTIEDEIIWVKIYAKPWYNHYFELDIPVGKRKKVQNDSILLRAVHPDYIQNASVDYYPQSEDAKYPTKYVLPRKSPNWEIYSSKIPYDEIKDGFFVAEFVQHTDTVAFQVEDWYQIQVLQKTPIELYPPKPQEKELIKVYLESLKIRNNQLEALENTYLKEIRDLKKNIQNLNQVIDSLTGRPPLIPKLEPIPEEEEEFYDNHIVVMGNAQPTQGFAALLESLKNKLQELNIKNAGNITVELEIEKDGYIYVTPLHVMQNSETIWNEVKRFLKEQEWQPARIRGKPFEQKIILSLNFIAEKQ